MLCFQATDSTLIFQAEDLQNIMEIFEKIFSKERQLQIIKIKRGIWFAVNDRFNQKNAEEKNIKCILLIIFLEFLRGIIIIICYAIQTDMFVF